LSADIQTNTQALQENQQQEQQVQSRLAIFEEKIAQLNLNLEKGSARMAQRQQELESKLTQLDFTFQEDSVALLQALHTSREHFQKALELQQESARSLERNAFNCQQNALELSRVEERLQSESHTIAAEEAALGLLQKQFISLVGNESIQSLRDKLQNALESAQQALQLQSQLLSQLRENNIASNTRLENALLERAKASEETVTIEKQLLIAAAVHELPDLNALQAAMLSPEEENKIRELKDSLARQEAELQRLMQETAAQLLQVLEETHEAPELNDLKKSLEEKETAWQQTQQKLGQCLEKLNRHEQQQQKAKALLKTIASQQKEYQRWAKLNDLIGSADGKKFRTFAQGLTLAKLIQLANRHLQHLNGRYVILKKSNEDLGLEIMDTYQANNRRGMRTLSGGESFLVSLALALALSELAGRNTSIQSLFIDEGFGTLDDSSLDMAISTLENLQSSGKTIGIISHVKELKERIGVQIQVKKQSDGFSQIKVINA
jgi:exonuclease SbcC